MSRTEKLLAELSALPGVNPAFLPPRQPPAGVKRGADFLAPVAAQGAGFLEVPTGHSPVRPAFPDAESALQNLQYAGRSWAGDLHWPRTGHVPEMLDRLGGGHPCAAVSHGEVELRAQKTCGSRSVPVQVTTTVAKDAWLPQSN